MRRLGVLIALAIVVVALAFSWSSTRGASTVHRGISATVFWVGEQADRDNAYIPNDASAWDSHWQRHFGGLDDPNRRTADGYWPAGFKPRENPFYVALPYCEFTDDGKVKPSARSVPWYDPAHPPSQKRSILKNQWVRIVSGSRVVYAQWEDAGPMNYDDVDYVFGSGRPSYKSAGIDLSPATANYLKIRGRGTVSWSFVSESQVPDGPWKQIITTSQVSWS